MERANWFFYRELFENWHPVYANSYELYWDRNTEPGVNTLTAGFEVRVNDVNDSAKKIVVQCNSQVNGVADVYIDYTIKKNNRRSSKLVIQTELQVVNTGTLYSDEYYESNYLRRESAEYILILITNGYGEVTITSNPASNTYLQLNAISCDKIYTVLANFLEINSISENEDNSTRIVVPFTQKNLNSVNGAIAILYNGAEAEILGITQEESGICITVSGELQRTHNNIIKLVKEMG